MNEINPKWFVNQHINGSFIEIALEPRTEDWFICHGGFDTVDEAIECQNKLEPTENK